jgi:hypothetical protein
MELTADLPNDPNEPDADGNFSAQAEAEEEQLLQLLHDVVSSPINEGVNVLVDHNHGHDLENDLKDFY